LRRLGIRVEQRADVEQINAALVLHSFSRLIAGILDGMPSNVPQSDADRWIQNRINDLYNNGFIVTVKGIGATCSK
jgi:hypothetical protein